MAPDLREALLTALRSGLVAEGKVDSAARYTSRAGKFLDYLAANQLDLETMPEDTVQRFVEQASASPVTRNIDGTSLRRFFDVARGHGIQVATVQVPSYPTHRKAPVTIPPVQPAPPAVSQNPFVNPGMGAAPVTASQSMYGGSADVPVQAQPVPLAPVHVPVPAPATAEAWRTTADHVPQHVPAP